MENIKNPFTPSEKRASKRLFGKQSERESFTKRIEAYPPSKEKLVKYGEREIKEKQAKFLLEIERIIIALQEKEGRIDLTLEDVRKWITDPMDRDIEVDEDGNLYGLDLHALWLEAIPNLRGLKHLHVLNCNHNGLKELPGLNSLRELEVLRCEGNNLTSLQGIDRLTNLQWLSCAGNKLSQLPDLTQHKKLKSVSLIENFFSKEERAKIKKQLPADCAIRF